MHLIIAGTQHCELSLLLGLLIGMGDFLPGFLGLGLFRENFVFLLGVSVLAGSVV